MLEITKEKILKFLKSTQQIVIFLNLIVLFFIILILFKMHNNTKSLYAINNPEIQNLAKKIFEDCRYTNASCYKKTFESLIMDHDFTYAEKTLFALQDLDPTTKSCHVLAHFMSRTAVKKNPSDWLSIFDNIDVNACGSGFLHGVLESHLGDNPDTKFDAKLSEEVCNRGEDIYRKRMCTHFMGHFFIVNTNDNVEKAVPYCDGVSPDLKFDCLDGLFMEHNQKIALEDHGLAKLPTYTPEYAKSLEDVCLKYSGPQAGACATELAEVYAKTFGYNADVIYEHCHAKKNRSYGGNCYGKGETILSTYPMDLNAKQMTDICKFFEKEEMGYKICIQNILASLMYYSPKFTERGLLLCQNIPNYKDWCVEELGKKLKNLVASKDDRTFFCKNAENKKYKDLCVQ